MKRVKVTKAGINPLGFTDIFTHAQEMLERKNLTVTRLRRKECLRRKRMLKKKMFESVKDNEDGSRRMNDVAEAGFRRLQL